MLAEVSFSFFFSVFSQELLRKPVLKKCCSVFYEGSFSMENGLKPSNNLSKIFFKKKIKLKRLKDDTFLRFFEHIYLMRKSSSSKMSALKQRFLANFTSERTEPHPSQVCKFWWKSYEVPLMKRLIVRRLTVYLSSHCSRFLNRQHKARAPYNNQGSRQFEGTGVLLCAIWLKHESFSSVFKFCNWSQTRLRIFGASLRAECFKHSANSFFPKSSYQ